MKFTLGRFLSEQFVRQQPVVTADLTGKTVIVVGANTGLGLEAAMHFARMKPGRLILGCRNEGKGQAAIKAIEKDTGYREAELWLIDLSKFSSVTDFAEKFEQDGGRLDVLVMNAGINTATYTATADNFESTLQVNHLSTSLLSLLLFPHLVKTGRETARSRLVIVSSEVHYFAKLSEQELNSSNLMEFVSTKDYCTKRRMFARYPMSKMFNVMFIRSLNTHLPTSTPIIVNTVNPGLCISELTRDLFFPLTLFVWISNLLLAHTTEEGSRTLVYAALAHMQQPDEEEKLRGAFLWGNKVVEVSDFLVSPEGEAAQARVWTETINTLSKVSPKVEEIVKEYLV